MAGGCCLPISTATFVKYQRNASYMASVMFSVAFLFSEYSQNQAVVSEDTEDHSAFNQIN